MTSRSTAGLDGVVPIEFMPVSMKEGRVPAGRWDGGRIHYSDTVTRGLKEALI